MKAYDLILNTTYLGQELEEATYYFRIDFAKVLELKKAISVYEFSTMMKDVIDGAKTDFGVITGKFSEAGIQFVNAEDYQIWQNNFKDIVISVKGVIQNANDFKETLEKITTIKSALLKEGIFIKITNYVD